eukprot:618940-Prorocentrum_minimum.AAC.1
MAQVCCDVAGDIRTVGKHVDRKQTAAGHVPDPARALPELQFNNADDLDPGTGQRMERTLILSPSPVQLPVGGLTAAFNKSAGSTRVRPCGWQELFLGRIEITGLRQQGPG